MKRISLLLFVLAMPAWGQPYEQISPEDHSWHLLQKQYDGLIRSVQSGLTKHECEFAKARATGQPATDEERKAKDKYDQEAFMQICPLDTKEAWREWNLAHPIAHGCRSMDGNISTSWGGQSFQMTDISSAECFQ